MKPQKISPSFGTKDTIVKRYNHLVERYNTVIDAIENVSKRALEERCDEAKEYVEELYREAGLEIAKRCKVTMIVDLPFGNIDLIYSIVNGDDITFCDIEKVEEVE